MQLCIYNHSSRTFISVLKQTSTWRLFKSMLKYTNDCGIAQMAADVQFNVGIQTPIAESQAYTIMRMCISTLE